MNDTMNETGGGNGGADCCSGCTGCAAFLAAFLFFWALLFGLPTSGGTLNIDILPPYIGVDADENTEND